MCDWDSNLPQDQLEKAELEHKKADLVIVVGSSLRIRPAGNFPMKTKRQQIRVGKPQQGKIVIINLQETHLDRQCELRIFSKCDSIFEQLMERLNT